MRPPLVEEALEVLVVVLQVVLVAEEDLHHLGDRRALGLQLAHVLVAAEPARDVALLERSPSSA